MTTKERKTIIETERNLWFDLQFTYWVRMTDYDKNAFSDFYEYQTYLNKFPEVERKRAMWCGVYELMEKLGIETEFDEEIDKMHSEVYWYFKK